MGGSREGGGGNGRDMEGTWEGNGKGMGGTWEGVERYSGEESEESEGTEER